MGRNVLLLHTIPLFLFFSEMELLTRAILIAISLGATLAWQGRIQILHFFIFYFFAKV